MQDVHRYVLTYLVAEHKTAEIIKKQLTHTFSQVEGGPSFPLAH